MLIASLTGSRKGKRKPNVSSCYVIPLSKYERWRGRAEPLILRNAFASKPRLGDKKNILALALKKHLCQQDWCKCQLWVSGEAGLPISSSQGGQVLIKIDVYWEWLMILSPYSPWEESQVSKSLCAAGWALPINGVIGRFSSNISSFTV